MIKRLLIYCSIFITSACVDRISIYTGQATTLPLVIDGFISDLPGPYTVKVTSSFDNDSGISTRIAQEVKQMTISDDHGTQEQLIARGNGIYQTTGIQGQAGRVYKLRIELLDGKVYESLPDTLLPPPSLDSIYYELNDHGNGLYTTLAGWGFDVFAHSSSGESRTSAFMWQAKGTFRTDTHPEAVDPAKSKCYRQDPDNGQCSFKPPCSGLYNDGTTRFPHYSKVRPCTCCTCWYEMYNQRLTLSENRFRQGPSTFPKTTVFRAPVSPLLFMYKMYIEISMQSLTAQTFDFWKVIRNQQEAVGSIFQPITGKIASRFVQVNGAEVPITGIFYAAGMKKLTRQITRDDIIPATLLEAIPGNATAISCLELFPNSTNVKPAFWVD